LFVGYLTMQYQLKAMYRRMLGLLWVMNWKGGARRRSRFILLYYPSIFLQTSLLNAYIKLIKYNWSCLNINGFDFSSCTGTIWDPYIYPHYWYLSPNTRKVSKLVFKYYWPYLHGHWIHVPQEPEVIILTVIYSLSWPHVSTKELLETKRRNSLLMREWNM
jgi:hypothetical protein